MNPVRFARAASIFILALADPVSAAVGTALMSWDACTPAVDNKNMTDPGPYSIFVSLLGNDMWTTSYQVRAIYADGNQTVPDAWRFDPEGCQGSNFVTIDHRPPAALSKTCPPMDQYVNSIQIKNVNFTPFTDPYSTTTMRILLANAYLAGAQAEAATRYFLAGFTFDHASSVAGAGTPTQTCGGFESSMCFKLTVVEVYDESNNGGYPIPLGAWNTGSRVVTFNGGSACLAIPARATTWGTIKSQYRN